MSWEKVARKEIFGQLKQNKIVTDESTFEDVLNVIDDCKQYLSKELEELIVYVVEHKYYSRRKIIDYVFRIRNKKTKEEMKIAQEVLLFTLQAIKKHSETKTGI